MSALIGTIMLNNINVTYHIERKSVKNINIRIKSDGIVYISASRSVSEKYIRKLLITDGEKISAAINSMKLSQNQKSDTDFMWYLGRKYPISVVYDENEKTELTDELFSVHTNEPTNRQHVIYLIKRWQADRCQEIYKKINEEVSDIFKDKGYTVPHARVYIKDMKTRWGSCNARDGKISMNLRLIEYPIECIYAVFYHEYAHFIHHNHSKDFHNFLNNIYPEYKKWDKILKTQQK
ncbi:MAG TPA: DUF45 domain-containing protein [Oscillospiraceae bacterium]|nr:DUF45 domain-containing protein [Oscillospiraceae bacterium]